MLHIFGDGIANAGRLVQLCEGLKRPIAWNAAIEHRGAQLRINGSAGGQCDGKRLGSCR